MSFLAKLFLGSTEYNILNVDYEISQLMDHCNRPNAAPKGGLIQLEVETGNNQELLEWMIRPNLLKNGRIVFFRRDLASALKTISFTDAFCVYLKESFRSDGRQPMITRFTLSARELKINEQLSLVNPWPGMRSSASEKNPAASGEKIVSFSPLEDM